MKGKPRMRAARKPRAKSSKKLTLVEEVGHDVAGILPIPQSQKTWVHKIFKTRTGWLFMIAAFFSAIITIDKGVPIAQRWWHGAVDATITHGIHAGVDEAKKTAQKALDKSILLESAHASDMKAVHAEVGAIRSDMRVGQQQNSQMMYHIWEDVRQIRGLPAPPTPEPIPTIDPTMLTSAEVRNS